MAFQSPEILLGFPSESPRARVLVANRSQLVLEVCKRSRGFLVATSFPLYVAVIYCTFTTSNVEANVL
jgi:hypothetical protein